MATAPVIADTRQRTETLNRLITRPMVEITSDKRKKFIITKIERVEGHPGLVSNEGPR